MKIGIISDTHDQVEKIKKAIEIFNNEKVDLVYHLGDMCSPFMIHLFKNLKCKVKGVFGNNDADVFKHVRDKPDNVSFHDKFYVDEVNGKKICLVHGDPEELVTALFDSKRYDLLLKGHNHIAEIKKNKKTLMINPGNLVGSFIKKYEHWTEPSVAIYDFEKDNAKIIKI